MTELTVLEKMNTISHVMGEQLIIGTPTSFATRIIIWNDGTLEYKTCTIPQASKFAVIKGRNKNQHQLLFYASIERPCIADLPSISSHQALQINKFFNKHNILHNIEGLLDE